MKFHNQKNLDFERNSSEYKKIFTTDEYQKSVKLKNNVKIKKRKSFFKNTPLTKGLRDKKLTTQIKNINTHLKLVSYIFGFIFYFLEIVFLCFPKSSIYNLKPKTRSNINNNIFLNDLKIDFDLLKNFKKK